MTNDAMLKVTPRQVLPPDPIEPQSCREARITWLFNCVGTPDSLLYWNQILPGYLERFPHSEFWTARPPAKPILGTDKVVRYAGSWRIPLGKRRGSYDRQVVIPSPGILQSLRRSRPDLVIVQELLAYAVYLALYRNRLASTRLLLLLESDPIRQIPQRKSRWVRMVRRWAAQRMDWCLTNNESGRDYLNRELGFPAHRILVKPYLVSQPPEALLDASCVALPAEARQDLGKTIFLCVGQLIERKGIRQMIETVAALDEELRRDARFWIIGDGVLRSELEQLATRLGLQGTVRFLGSVPYDHLSLYYRTANCFVMPTLDDYRALVGFEALSHGLPLLHSRYDGAATELVVAGENGYIVDPRNTVEFAQRIGDMLRRRDDLVAMGQASARRAQDHFTLRHAVQNLSSAIAQVLANPIHRQAGSSCAC